MSASASVLYRVSLPHPERHLCEVELRIQGAGALGHTVALAMAAWSPGSYLIRDYSRFVRNLRAFDGAGAPRPVRKQRKDLWEVSRQGADELVVRYEVYGHDLTVRTNHIDQSHAFLHGPATYLYVEALRDRQCRVQVVMPAGRGWHVATGLEPEAPGAGLPEGQPEGHEAVRSAVRSFVAADLDELMDSPIHLGPGPLRELTAASTPVRLALWGALDGRAADVDRLVRDLSAIIDTHAARLGGTLPFDHYTFILMLAPDAYGGLEHRNSSANLHTPLAANSRKSYEGLLELLSHEFFHVWNGKRLYPEAHCPFDYSREAYTRCLWVMEGLTSYYDRYTVLRAGLQTPRRYLEKLAEEWGRLLGTPGRTVHSMEEASFDAWIKLYKPDEFNLNSTVSYYLKGGLVALILDLLIRQRSAGAGGPTRGLDDVLRLLWAEYGQAGRPYPEDVQALFEKAAGMELGGFFDACVRGCEDPDLAGALAGVGLSLRALHDPDLAAEERQAVWLGVMLQGGSARVARVLDGTPASADGLSPGDEIIAIDGLRVQSEADLRQRLPSRAPGDRVAVALFRRGRLMTVELTLGEAPPSRIEIASMAEPTDAQRQAFADWLGEDHPGAGLSVTANVQQWC